MNNDLNFCAFEKKSKNNAVYYNGDVMVNGTAYWISIFKRKDKNGKEFLSGVLSEKNIKKFPKYADHKKASDDFLNDDIPF